MMIPPHERPWYDETLDLVLGHPCWCDPITMFEHGVDDDGNPHVWPHRWHRDDGGMPILVAHARVGQATA